jgi:hypothetical protein
MFLLLCWLLHMSKVCYSVAENYRFDGSHEYMEHMSHLELERTIVNW